MSLAEMFDRSSGGYALNVSEYADALVFKDGNLVSGKLDALIKYLVPTPYYHPDRTYIFAFLLCSRIYIQPYSLMKEVCMMCINQMKLAEESGNKNRLGKFGPHVIKLMNEWTELFPYDFRDDYMMKLLQDLSQRVVSFYPELRRDVSNLLQNLFCRIKNLQRYEDILSKLNSEMSYKCQACSSPTTRIVEICDSPLQLAEQLTHIEVERLSQIGPEEFIQTFMKHHGSCQAIFPDKKTRNLELYVQWFNHLSYFVATDICMHLKKKTRAKRIDFFIDVAKECINLGNFNSVMAIVAGLNLSPVSRLKKTWEKVNLDKFKILEHQVNPSKNFISYRSCLKAALWRSQSAVNNREKIIIPFFSLFMKDLYFINECCSDALNENYVNFDKFWQVSKQISEFMTWQHIVCPFEKKTDLLHYILTAPVLTETTLFLASYECEIPETSSDKSMNQRLKKEMKP